MPNPRTIAALVVAAGRGERAGTGDVPKQYRRIAGRAVLSRTIDAFLADLSIAWVLPVIHPDHAELYAALGLADDRLLSPVSGGATRQSSVLEGLKALSRLRPHLVLIQDAARPFVDDQIIAGVVDSLRDADGAIPAIPVTDTLKRSPDGRAIVATEDRRTLFAAQTPQGFRYPQIFSAHMRAAGLPSEFTDDAAVAEWAGLRTVLSPGSARNIKITLPGDFARAEQMLGGSKHMENRVGTGFDVHPFEPGDGVWLGGVHIPHTKKLKGHSDADAPLHALTDAIYGAIGEGDIGTHFPPGDPQWKGAASRLFLEHAAGLVAARHGRIVNLDLTIVCESPRISPHVAAMRQVIAEACSISPSRVAIKATTSERLGFTGREEGLMAMATASVLLPEAD